MLYDWLKIMKMIPENKDAMQDFICPVCGTKSIKYIYVGDTTTRIGYLPIWCTNCNMGIQISRVSIPQDARMIEITNVDCIKNTIPNFKILDIHHRRCSNNHVR